MIRIPHAAVALALLSFTASPASAAIIGAEVNLNTTSPCPSFCGPNPVSEFADQGGANVGSANLALNNSYGMGSGSVNYVGSDLVPHLTAVAKPDSNSRYSVKSTGYRAWDYVGPGTTLTLDVTFSATLSSPGSVLDAQIRGIVGIVMGQELPHVTDQATFWGEYVPGTPGLSECGVRFDVTLLANVAGEQTVPGSVSCAVQNGDRIFAWSQLSGKALRGGVAESANSLTMVFSDSAGLTSVPEPSLALLAGVAGLGLALRSRR